ncbi:spore coat protein [Pseudomonas agarici]|uniref:Spore coat protein n=1 Tax=Pseudomonas agarici TaxID=46677 RepID=A0A0X1T1B1_PSEAA|nr:spore coat U domain-containing protein [Pseudomonas agarici]AMB85659.1 spore coat protein [Pseudomonas agarici]NWB91058.1 spore coat protein U domain-containing protein [Pseudomonas agarici]NWC09579.1 spore coat protein U domain-containing protein [Pseudomonas agarici]SEL22560.1 Spore coat protein U (SCPU) domain-containing protein [Pseudomonas agarici]
MVRRGCALVLLACASSLSLPLAAVTSASLQVSASIIAGCLVVGGGSHYGNLNYGSYSALSTGAVSISLTGGVQLQCTPGVSLSMSVDGGQNNSSGRHLKLNSGTAQVAYQLFSDAGLSQALGISQSVNIVYGNANNISLPIYGRVVLPGNQPPGTYSDVLQVQLSW